MTILSYSYSPPLNYKKTCHVSISKGYNTQVAKVHYINFMSLYTLYVNTQCHPCGKYLGEGLLAKTLQGITGYMYHISSPWFIF